MYYIYMLICDDNSLYTGITNNLKERVITHYYKKPNCAKYTRSHQVVDLSAVWTTDEKGNALRLEKFIKSLPKSAKQNLADNQNLLSEFVGDRFDFNAYKPYEISFGEIINEQSKQNA